MTWPTPHPGPAADAAIGEFIQPTVSGEVRSGLFGCVRNNGSRFHEGIDVVPYLARDGRGEATDRVVAAFAGRVVHVNAVAGDSSYGRYVVLEHSGYSPAIYTLYAHLASIDPGLRVGNRVDAGRSLGVMGRSAGGYVIPRQRAHLHFEIGVRLTEKFQSWYDRQRFGSRNEHGLYNGMNLMGLDPLHAYRWLKARPQATMTEYYASLSPAVIVDVVTSRIPDFVRRYPGLVTGGTVPERVAGWRVSFTGWGLPLGLEPLRETSDGARAGQATVVAIDPAELERYGCRQMVSTRAGEARPGNGLQQLLELLFDFY